MSGGSGRWSGGNASDSGRRSGNSASGDDAGVGGSSSGGASGGRSGNGGGRSRVGAASESSDGGGRWRSGRDGVSGRRSDGSSGASGGGNDASGGGGVSDGGDGAGRNGGGDSGGGDEAAARRIALDALSRAARTRGQLEALLQRKGIAPEIAAVVLDRFEEVGLIDDRDYAEAFVESRHRVRGQGGRALSMELRRRGVANDVVAEAVGGLDPELEFETACRIALSRYERMPAVPTEVKVRRLAGFLARKGYSGTIVTRAVRYVVDSVPEAVDSSAMGAAEALDGMDEATGEAAFADDGGMDGGTAG